MKRAARPTVYVIDLPLNELVVRHATTVPAKGREAGIVPSAMEQYIRKAQVVPLWPDVSYDGTRFLALSCDRCLTAARSAGFAGTVRCVYREAPERLQPPLRARLRSLADVRKEVEAPETVPSWQVLSFSRPLKRDERLRVLAELERLAQSAKARGTLRFSEVLDPEWVAEDALAWRTWSAPNTEDRSMGADFAVFLNALKDARVRPIAWNGRAVQHFEDPTA